MIATIAVLQVRDNEGLNLDSDLGNKEGGRPELLQRYNHQDVAG